MGVNPSSDQELQRKQIAELTIVEAGGLGKQIRGSYAECRKRWGWQKQGQRGIPQRVWCLCGKLQENSRIIWGGNWGYDGNDRKDVCIILNKGSLKYCNALQICLSSLTHRPKAKGSCPQLPLQFLPVVPWGSRHLPDSLSICGSPWYWRDSTSTPHVLSPAQKRGLHRGDSKRKNIAQVIRCQGAFSVFCDSKHPSLALWDIGSLLPTKLKKLSSPKGENPRHFLRISRRDCHQSW